MAFVSQSIHPVPILLNNIQVFPLSASEKTWKLWPLFPLTYSLPALPSFLCTLVSLASGGNPWILQVSSLFCLLRMEDWPHSVKLRDAFDFCAQELPHRIPGLNLSRQHTRQDLKLCVAFWTSNCILITRLLVLPFLPQTLYPCFLHDWLIS